MKVTVKFFGPFVSIAGRDLLQIKDVKDISSLRKEIFQQFPEMERHTFSVFVNKQVVKGNLMLNDGDTVGMLPPYSGG